MSWQAIPLRSEAVIDRPIEDVRHALRRVDIWQRAAGAVGYQLISDSASAVWQDGATVRLGRLDGRLRHTAVARLDEHDVPAFKVSAGPAAGAELTLTLSERSEGVQLTAQFASTAPSSALQQRVVQNLQARHHRQVIWSLRMLLGMVSLEQHQTRLVVAGAIVRDHKVLAARRTYPAAAAGKWEFPGGKVGLGETDEQALRRELSEELGVSATVAGRIGPEISLDVELVLRLYRVTIGELPLEHREHDEIRWLSAAELDAVDWLDADRRLLPTVRISLTAGT